MSNVWKFRVWSVCRTYLVPFCILAAMIAVMFSSALGVVPALEEVVGQGGHSSGLGDIVIRSLFIAAALMVLHTVYLSLMAFHLVYRFPIENRKWIGLVYVFLVFAYVAHAVHSADTAHANGGGWESSLGFAVVYLFMSVHGRHHGEDRRPTQLQRANWMGITDLFMLAVTALMFVRDIHFWDWAASITPLTTSIVGSSGILRAIYQQSSPKDGIVTLALCAYILTKLATHSSLRKGQPVRSDKVQKIQHFDFTEDYLKSIHDALPVNASWLDIGSGHGTQIHELLQVMFETEIARLKVLASTPVQKNAPAPDIKTRFPHSIVLLDRDQIAIDKATNSPPPWWPAQSSRQCRRLDMTAPAAVQLLKGCKVAHMSHVAYQPGTVGAAVRLLKEADRDTLLLLRYTSDTSFYRVISSSTSCAPIRPYIHHHMHRLLLSDLERHGWQQKISVILKRTCRIATRESVTDTVDWCDAQYGEFSGDIIERYFKRLRDDDESAVANYDRLVLLTKTS